MDIEYQLDPSTNSIFHQLATTPATTLPAGRQATTTSAIGRSSSSWSRGIPDTSRGLTPPVESHPTPSSSWVVSQAPPSTAISSGPTTALPPVSPASYDLQATLNSIRDSLQYQRIPTHQAPPVVVINNLPPSNSGGWAVEPDQVAIGGAVAAVLIVVVCGVLLWLRRYRPDTWRNVRTATIRILRFLALPASWLCGKAAGLLRSFHQDTQVGDFCLFYLYSCFST